MRFRVVTREWWVAMAHALRQRARRRRSRFATAAGQLAAIVASADDAIVGKTLDGIITSWNHAAEAMFGYTAAEAIGKPITLIIPPDRRDEEFEILRRLRRGEAIHHFETERVAKDGRRVALSLAISPVRDETGRVVGASKIARDISERRRSERVLRDTMQTLEVLYRLSDAVSRAKDLDAVCDAAVDAIMAAGADRASVLLFDPAGVMRFQAWRQLSAAYRASVDGHSPWSRDTMDPQAIVIEDVLADTTLGSLRDVVTAEGIRALAFVPLVSQGHLLGKFMIYHDAAHAFSASEIRLASSIAHHVAFGVARVQAEASVETLLTAEQAARREAEGARLDAERKRTMPRSWPASPG